ncbi:MAG TPA: GntR family transcriptional regulator [Pusillimonas sp.]|uniref:GntR family transcriptional regulator n=1 Tax=Pusillimonas sp. TaxID=3040095 RepID=UPI002B4AC626|nr:GntR family transcriptional regulator [Pusillimonas sp.]HLU20565.1 GntR family transcriptional regulator [Pusillimonas sp.]
MSAERKEIPFRAPPSMAESIIGILRDRLAGGVYPPGSWIRESALAEEFQISNGPIREALQTLVNDGLLVREPWKGMRVVSLGDEEIVELFQFRLALQELAAELAAKHATPEQIVEARRLLAAMDDVLERGDIDAQMPLGGQLAQWLCACSGNSRLEQNWSRLTYQTRMYIYASLRDAKDLRLIAQLWHELVDAIEKRDGSAARTAVRKLARRTLDDLQLSLDL